MTYRWSTILVLCIVPLFAMAQQDGSSCERAIPVDADYKGTVPAAGTYWYTATTYDLPLIVHFSPVSDNCEERPTIEVDFTCTPGYYDDPKLAEVILSASDWNVEVPMKFTCSLVLENGGRKKAYELSIAQNYREQLAAFGITYNVRAYVKVHFPEAGTITMTPDTLFRGCIDNAYYMGKQGLPDTVYLLPQDSDRTFIMPYADWKNDSMRLVWNGKQPVQVFLATTRCDFYPSCSNAYVWDCYPIEPDSLIKIYPNQMQEAIDRETGGGLFYTKILSDSPGRLVVEKIPRSLPKNNATLLQYGRTVSLAANDTNRLFAFPREWTATQLAATTRHLFTTYISAEPVFHLSAGDSRVLRVIQGYLEEGRRMVYFSDVEMNAISSKAQDDYLYVRFACNEATTVTPDPWTASECALRSSLIVPNEPFLVPASSSSTVFRFRYADIEGYDLTIRWNGNGVARTYIAETCSFNLSPTNEKVVFYKSMARKTSVTISSADIGDWKGRVFDTDGYLYVRFNATTQGRMTFLSSKPAEEKLPYTTATIYLQCQGDRVLVSVSQEQDLTLIDAAGQTVRMWHQTPKEMPYPLLINGETYTIVGKDEKITIKNNRE